MEWSKGGRRRDDDEEIREENGREESNCLIRHNDRVSNGSITVTPTRGSSNSHLDVVVARGAVLPAHTSVVSGTVDACSACSP